MPISLEHHYLNTNNVSLHLVQAGPSDGPLVILLHGFPEFWYGWRHQIPALAEAGYHVWVPDQRGYNLSEKPRALSAYNLDRLADDVLGLIEASGEEKIYLAGHDWGAAVAWWVAIKYPECLHKLAILNVPHPIVMRRYMTTHFKQLLKSWYMFFFQLPVLPERILTRDEAEVASELLVATSRHGSFSPAELDQYRRAWLRPRAMTSMLNWYRAMLHTHTARLESLRVTVPTLILWGVHDVALSKEMAPLSLEMCDEGQVRFFESATHWLQHDEPHHVNQLLVDFFG